MKTKVLKPKFERQDKRGELVEIINGKNFKNLSYGDMKKGAVMGNHFHKKTSVSFFLTKGGAQITLKDIKTGKENKLIINQGEGVEIPPYHHHIIKFIKTSSFIMSKSLKYDPKDTYE